MLLFVAVTALVSGGLLSAALTSRRLAHRDYNRERAMQAAEAGLECMCQTIQQTFGLLPTTVTTNGVLDGVTWSCTATKVAEYRFRLDSTGTVEGVKWCVHAAEVEAPSWAEFALWMDRNGVIYFGGGEVFYGRVHSNDMLYFDVVNGIGPAFYETLSSASNTFGGTTNGSIFDKGFLLNAQQDTMASVDFATLKTQAQTYGNLLSGNTFVTFNGNNMRISNTRAGWTNYNMAIGTNRIVYVQKASTGPTNTSAATLVLGGRLDGRVTFVTEDDISITNNITYASDPRTNAASDDALGLVSYDDIWVATNAPNNLEVFAAMMATGAMTNESGSFGVVGYNQGTVRGNLTVYGSIVQEVRGAVASGNSGGMTSGYVKNYSYDRRFSVQAPPYFPRLKTKLTMGQWREGPT